MNGQRIVVVGAGVIGLASARELAYRGHDVVLVDKTCGGGASHVASGILTPLRPWQAHTVVDRLAAHSQTLYGEFVDALGDESGIDVQYINSGLLIVGDTHAAAATEWSSASGLPVEVLDRSGLTALVPDIARVREGVYLPHVHQIRVPDLLEALTRSCAKLGVDIRTHEEVLELPVESRTIKGVATTKGKICADAVVVAAGAWSDLLAGSLGLRLNVNPVRSQVIWYQDSVERAARPVLDDGEHYVVTRCDGVTLVGGTVEHVGFDSNVTDKAMKRLVNKAKNLIVGLGELTPQGHWSGVRPARAHGIPLIGAHPAIEGLYLNTGHFRNGVTLAPGSALLLADIVEGVSESGVGVSTL